MGPDPYIRFLLLLSFLLLAGSTTRHTHEALQPLQHDEGLPHEVEKRAVGRHFTPYQKLKELETPEQLYKELGFEAPPNYVLDPRALADLKLPLGQSLPSPPEDGAEGAESSFLELTSHVKPRSLKRADEAFDNTDRNEDVGVELSSSLSHPNSLFGPEKPASGATTTRFRDQGPALPLRHVDLDEKLELSPSAEMLEKGGKHPVADLLEKVKKNPAAWPKDLASDKNKEKNEQDTTTTTTNNNHNGKNKFINNINNNNKKHDDSDAVKNNNLLQQDAKQSQAAHAAADSKGIFSSPSPQPRAGEQNLDTDPQFHELPFADQLYLKLYHIFGNEDTLLTMEWPGRVLDEKSFSYPITDAYSGFLKPVAVRDAEFSIADEMFTPTQITGGPTGNSLATMYKLVLDELTESTDYPADAYKKRRESIIKELAKEYDGPKGKMSLREIHEYYLNKYVETKTKMQEKLNKKKNEARLMMTPKPNPLDNVPVIGLLFDNDKELNKALSTKDALMDQIPILNDEIHQTLNSAWKDLIIEGRHHEVMSMLSILDVQSPGELLQETKDRMRNTGISSLDGTEVTYPVWFQPRDWASHLSTKFTTRDLLLEPDAVMQEVARLQDQKESMLLELTSLQDLQTGDAEAMKRQVAKAQKDLNNAREGINMLPMSAEAVRIVADAVCQSLSDCFDANKAPTERFISGFEAFDSKPEILKILKEPAQARTEEQQGFVSNMITGVSNFINARGAYSNAAAKYHDAIQAATMAQATDFKARQVTLSRDIRDLEVKIQQKMAQLAGARPHVNLSSEPMTPVGSQAGPWMDIVFATSASSARSVSKMSGSTTTQ
eukprot:g79059.t1